ncbi:MAG TPA: NBR1-Ig-like domain-containing protein [Anaerolineales bacterium]|nr:NBR1-Ig-like domain-containing protein [Anaerolineales bacterium]
MRKIPYLIMVVLSVGGLLAGCNLPFFVENQPSVQTAAALTVAAQLTAVAPATATYTPAPFPTLPPAATNTTAPPANTLPPASTATSTCDVAQFVTDVTIPDGTVIGADDTFTKTWRLKNAGTCSWTPSYAVVFVSGTAMSGPSVQALSGNTNPGQTLDVSVNLTAPSADGTYTGYYGLRNAAGSVFTKFYVQIQVNSTGGGFAVTHVTYTVSTFDEGGNHGCPLVTAHITTNGTGDVDYHWTRSDGATVSPDTLHFTAAGTKDLQYKWTLGSAATGTNWVGMYIDDPNHQDFGHTNVTPCTSP